MNESATTEAQQLEPVAAVMERLGLRRKRARLVIEVDLDPVPGWGNTPEDYRALTQRLLDDAIGHYHPTVTCDS